MARFLGRFAVTVPAFSGNEGSYLPDADALPPNTQFVPVAGAGGIGKGERLLARCEGEVDLPGVGHANGVAKGPYWGGVRNPDGSGGIAIWHYAPIARSATAYVWAVDDATGA